MKSVSVKGQKRENLGKKESKKLRSNDLIPAVLYGGEEVLHCAIPFSELRKIVYTPHVYLIDLEIDGEVHKAMMQDIQWHPVEEQALHVDFLRVSEDKPVKIDIPVNIQGMAPGVKAGGKQNVSMRKMRVKALAKDLPDLIDIDVTKLEIGQSIKVGDLSVENLEFLDNNSSMIVSVISSRAAKAAMGALPEDEEEAEGAELEEGAEGAEGVEGEATETPASEE